MNGSFLNACRALYLELGKKSPDSRTEAENDFRYHFAMLPEVQRILEDARNREEG